MTNIPDVFQHNRLVWNKEVDSGNIWTVPVGAKDIADARRGELPVLLTPTKPVPREWLGQVLNKQILGLACGGGQQVPLFAAAGARVTSFDLSERQLDQDRYVAERENLNISLVQGNMSEPWPFADNSFDIIFNPVSLCFVPDLAPIWREAARVLRPGGSILAGFINPISYGFDFELKNQGVFQLKYILPYADLTSLSEAERNRYIGTHAPLEFSHTLTTMIQGQLDAGFVITGFYEDHWGQKDPIDKYFPSFFATKSVKADNAINLRFDV